MESFLAQLRANRVTLRHLMAAARTADDMEVFESRETAVEVLRQLCGHIDRLIAEKGGDVDLRAAYDDLERRFQVWRDGEQQRIRDHQKMLKEIEASRATLDNLRDLIWSAYESMDDTNERVQDGFSALEQAEIVIQAADKASGLLRQVNDLEERVGEVEKFVSRVRGSVEDDDE